VKQRLNNSYFSKQFLVQSVQPASNFSEWWGMSVILDALFPDYDFWQCKTSGCEPQLSLVNFSIAHIKWYSWIALACGGFARQPELVNVQRRQPSSLQLRNGAKSARKGARREYISLFTWTCYLRRIWMRKTRRTSGGFQSVSGWRLHGNSDSATMDLLQILLL